eukprot:352312-Chlamydomonas_euryale.AAC.17
MQAKPTMVARPGRVHVGSQNSQAPCTNALKAQQQKAMQANPGFDAIRANWKANTGCDVLA